MKNFNINKIIRPHLLSLKTYDAVNPPDLLSKKSGIPENDLIKLNGNENPYGASPKAIAALKNLPMHLYPDPDQIKIRNAISKYTGLPIDNIVAGAGADEIIDLIFRIFISPGDSILDCSPTFGMYSFCAKIAGANVKFAERDSKYDLDINEIEKNINENTKLIFITSPNNPTGNLVSYEHIKYLLKKEILVVVDEAYFEFSKSSVQNLVLDHSNLIVLRTMSKWAGLAGLRIGYGLMHSSATKYLMEIKPPYNINVAAEAALLASFEDVDLLQKNVDMIIENRDWMNIELNKINNLTAYPSFGNYILCEFTKNYSKTVYGELEENGIFVRKFNTERLKNSFRISIGTEVQNKKVLQIIQKAMKYE